MKIINLIESDRNKPAIVKAEVLMYATHPIWGLVLCTIIFVGISIKFPEADQNLNFVDGFVLLLFSMSALSVLHAFQGLKSSIIITHFGKSGRSKFYEGNKALTFARKNLKIYCYVFIASLIYFIIRILLWKG